MTTRTMRWTGRIITAVPVLFLVFDSVIKVLNIPPVVEAMARLGYPTGVAIEIGVLELACLALYLVPRTATIGAVLLTAFLGGAVATHVRVSDPMLSHTLFPTYIGALLWLGLLLRDNRVPTFIRAARVA